MELTNKKSMDVAESKNWEIEGASRADVTPEAIFQDRRNILKAAGFVGATTLLSQMALATSKGLPAKINSEYKVDEKNRPLTKEDLATSYNNFYEFSLDKGEVKAKVESWKLASDWKVDISGLVEQKKSLTVDELIDLAGGVEERIYRFRCVEAWSMVVPWTGFSLAKLISKLKPQASAKYVVFKSFNDRTIGTNMASLPQYPWPYTEGLRMDEAMHPLSFIATGLYGKELPKQNGAPLRLVVPWKYGFKSIKSIKKIEFTDQQPKTLWNDLNPSEYGFYANVNPDVDHPRWTQSTERVLDGKFLATRIATLKFNGYEKQVAGLYQGMDLKKNF